LPTPLAEAFFDYLEGKPLQQIVGQRSSRPLLALAVTATGAQYYIVYHGALVRFYPALGILKKVVELTPIE